MWNQLVLNPHMADKIGKAILAAEVPPEKQGVPAPN